LSGDYLAFFTSLIRQVCRRQVPVYSLTLFRWEDGRTMTTSRLCVPLGDADAGVTQVLGVHDFRAKASPRHPATLLCDVRQIEELARQELPFEPSP
jgi:hypothetical protein